MVKHVCCIVFKKVHYCIFVIRRCCFATLWLRWQQRVTVQTTLGQAQRANWFQWGRRTWGACAPPVDLKDTVIVNGAKPLCFSQKNNGAKRSEAAAKLLVLILRINTPAPRKTMERSRFVFLNGFLSEPLYLSGPIDHCRSP